MDRYPILLLYRLKFMFSLQNNHCSKRNRYGFYKETETVYVSTINLLNEI